MIRIRNTLSLVYVLFQNIGNIWLAKIDSPEIRLWSNASFELQKQMYICTWKFVYLTKQCCLFEAFLPQMLDVILSISKCITMPFILKGVPHFCSWLTYKLLTPFSSLPSIPGAAFILSKWHLLYTRKSSGLYHVTCFDENIISMSETTAIATE